MFHNTRWFHAVHEAGHVVAGQRLLGDWGCHAELHLCSAEANVLVGHPLRNETEAIIIAAGKAAEVLTEFEPPVITDEDLVAEEPGGLREFLPLPVPQTASPESIVEDDDRLTDWAGRTVVVNGEGVTELVDRIRARARAFVAIYSEEILRIARILFLAGEYRPDHDPALLAGLSKAAPWPTDANGDPLSVEAVLGTPVEAKAAPAEPIYAVEIPHVEAVALGLELEIPEDIPPATAAADNTLDSPVTPDDPDANPNGGEECQSR